MNFNNEDLVYLKGDKFSNGYKISIAGRQELLDRITLLKDIVRNKSVFHFGCVDHLPLIKDKLKRGTWLHEILTQESSECIGIDNNQEGIAYIQDELGYDNVVTLDVIKDELPDSISSKRWDFLILGEIVEHLDNPVLFLSSILDKINFDKIIITVPNAFNLNNVKNIFRGIELINSDHRFWFTPYTISKVLTEAGYTVESFTFCNGAPFGKPPLMPRLRRVLLKRFPALNNTLFVVASS